MAIRVSCPACKKTIVADDRHAGRKAKCPACGSDIRIPNVEPKAPPPPSQRLPEADVLEFLGAPPPTPPPQIQSGGPALISQDESLLSVAKPSPEGELTPDVTFATPIQRPTARRGHLNWHRNGKFIASCAGCVVLGYFLGREHLKWELRSALSSAAQAFSGSTNKTLRDPPAPTSSWAADPPPDDVPTLREVMNIDDASMRITETNDIWSKFAWVLQITNKGNEAVAFTAVIEFLDSDGFVVDEDYQFNLLVEANETATFRGAKLITSPADDSVESLNVKVRAD